MSSGSTSHSFNNRSTNTLSASILAIGSQGLKSSKDLAFVSLINLAHSYGSLYASSHVIGSDVYVAVALLIASLSSCWFLLSAAVIPPGLRLTKGLFGSVAVGVLGAAGRVVFGIDGAVVGSVGGVIVGSIGLHVVGIDHVPQVQILVPGIYVVVGVVPVPPVVPVLVVVVGGATVR